MPISENRIWQQLIKGIKKIKDSSRKQSCSRDVECSGLCGEQRSSFGETVACQRGGENEYLKGRPSANHKELQLLG